MSHNCTIGKAFLCPGGTSPMTRFQTRGQLQAPSDGERQQKLLLGLARR